MPLAKAEQLRFLPAAGFTVRADFDGGAMSSDFGPVLLRGIDRQIGLIDRLAAAFRDQRHPSYIDHCLRDLMAQRVFQMSCGYEDGNDANELRKDPVFKLGVERRPLDPETDLASASTFSRLENAATTKDVYRVARAFVEQFIASYADPPPSIILDLDHSEDRTHGQQPFSFYNAHYRSHCYLPLFVFEGLSGRLVTAVLRPGKRPSGAENAMILKRILRLLRQHWPDTHIVVRGDGHFASPELMDLIHDQPLTEFVFGLSGNRAVHRLAEPAMQSARQLHHTRCENARYFRQPPPSHTRIFAEFAYAARSWSRPWRVVVKAEATQLGDNPRFVVTSMPCPTAEMIYQDFYCGRGNDENYIKFLKCDLKSDRTSDSTFLGNHMRLLFACAGYVLHHALRTQTLAQTELAKAQPSTIIWKLFKIAVRVVQYKDRIRLHLPSSCPAKHLLKRVTEILYLVAPPVCGSP